MDDILKNERTMQMLRYCLIAGGMGLAGWMGAQVSMEQAADVADKVLPAIPALVSAGTAIYGLIIKRGTVAVPAEVVRASQLNPSVPTIPTASPVTGKVS